MSTVRFGRNGSRGIFSTALAVLIVFLLYPCAPTAQELEPRALTNVPVGMNFVLAGYSYSDGDILLDPAVPIDDLNAKLNTFVGAYVRAIDFFGMSGKVDMVIPYADGEWTGAVSGRDSSASRTGFGDPRLRLAVNIAGAPAMRKSGFRDYRPRSIVGASFQVIAPLGQYDPSKLINLGSNRWAFRPQIGVSYWTGPWILETYVSGWFFIDNTDFWGGNRLEQLPLGAVKIHVIHTMPKRRIWAALDAGYAIGGRTRINGVDADTRISTFRFGADLALPLKGGHTIKIAGTTGVRHERGPDFNAVAVTWQYLWGG
jgi:hypothetical protein